MPELVRTGESEDMMKKTDKRLDQLRRVRLDRHFDGDGVVLGLLHQIEGLQERLRLCDRQLAYFLDTGCDPDRGFDGDDEINEPVDVADLQKGWNAFLRAGGVSADDLSAFLRGGPIGLGVRVKRHLRLVSNNHRPRRRVVAQNGHDAA
jgi:hypothetical protein